MDTQTLIYLFVGASFALYIGIALWSRAGSTKEFYVAGGGVNPVVNGMATAAEAEKLLGVTRLRKVAGILRPDLYGKHAAATPAPVQRTAGDLTEQPGPHLGHGLSPWLLHGRRTKEDR